MAAETISPRVRELMRQGAELALRPPEDWLADLDEATLAGEAMRAVAEDPVLAAAIRRTNRSNLLFWAAANVRAPGEPVPANDGDAPIEVARDLVRRGLDESSLDAYRVGQSVAVRQWTQIACLLTSDVEELRALLDVSLRSIASFVDATVAAISARMQAEREDLTRGTHAEKREAVALLLDGAPIPTRRAEARLGHSLAGDHTAAVLWIDDVTADLGQLDRAVDALALAGSGRPLSVLASAASRWVWTHGRPDVGALTTALAGLPAVRVALGSTAAGVDGFRRSHLDALTTQRLLARLTSTSRIAAYDDIELVSLATADAEAADRFVKRTLGDLETAPAELRATVRAFLAGLGNASATAAALFTHRNTLLRRLQRADQLLPRPLAEHPLEVGIALDVVRWRGV